MKTVIMAAGKGTRFGDLTKNTPKPLLKVGGKPILWHLLSSLPSEIDEVVIVVDYLGSKIKDFFGNSFGKRLIKYVEQGKMTGTAGALWAARPLISAEKFLVLSGDNIYSHEDIKRLVKPDLAFGLHMAKAPDGTYHHVQLDKRGCIKSFKKSVPRNKILMASGVYVLDQRIFNYEPVLRQNGEFSLPHTILKMAVDYPIKGVMMNWLSGNIPEELEKMEEFLKLNKKFQND